MSIEAIRAALEAGPYKGPWINGHDEDSSLCLVGPHDGDGIVYSPVVRLHDFRTADFIAACNPSAIIELLDRLEAAEQKAKRYEWLAQECSSRDEPYRGGWSIHVEGPAPARHDCEIAFDAAIDAAMEGK